MLNKYKTIVDRRSPEPPLEEFEHWRSQYHHRSQTVSENFKISLGDLPKTRQISRNSEPLTEKSRDFCSGIGKGEGKGKNKKPSASTWSKANAPQSSVHEIPDERDPRHRPVRVHIQQRIRDACPDLQGSEWTARDGRALQRFLREHPELPADQINRMVDSRMDSEDAAPAPAHAWIPDLLRYSSGPLDRFGKLIRHRSTRHQAVDAALGSRSQHSEPLKPDNIAVRYMQPALEKAGLRGFRFHDLRHTFGSLLIQDGASLAYVKEQMGHSSIQITVDTYGHLVPGADISWVDRLDAKSEPQQSATQAQPEAPAEGDEDMEVVENIWLPPRDSNPDMLIQRCTLPLFWCNRERSILLMNSSETLVYCGFPANREF